MRILEITDDATYLQAKTLLSEPAGDESSEPALVGKIDSTRSIVEAVRKRGDAAVSEFTARFDGVELQPEQFELSKDEIDNAIESLDQSLVATLARAHDNIRKFHAKNLRQSWEEVDEDGTKLGQRITPIESAGVYVPGGKAFYPSTVLMNIVPARVAGVQEIVMVSPPSYQGSIHPLVLAAAKMAGATRVFRIGGAQSIAALAYGTEPYSGSAEDYGTRKPVRCGGETPHLSHLRHRQGGGSVRSHRTGRRQSKSQAGGD